METLLRWDTEGLLRYASNARRDGFTGMLAIHPAQVDPINEAFMPSSEEVDRPEGIQEVYSGPGYHFPGRHSYRKGAGSGDDGADSCSSDYDAFSHWISQEIFNSDWTFGHNPWIDAGIRPGV